MGKPWVAIVLDRARYTKKHGDDSIAITEVHDREIYYGPEGRSYETIVHELTHAYLVEMCVHSADLDRDALEEIFCELMGKRGDEILALGKKMALEILKRKL